jgi:hypothetical protein
MADTITIKHPQVRNQGIKAVPARFVATGVARGERISGVKGYVSNISSGERKDGTEILWIAKPFQGNKYRWMLMFDLTGQEGMYRLDVVGLGAGGGQLQGVSADTDEFEVKGKVGVVAIEYPADGQDITDESQYFTAYGTQTNTVVLANCGATPADFINDLLSINFWAATFPPLSSGTVQLIVTDNHNQSDTKTVVIH